MGETHRSSSTQRGTMSAPDSRLAAGPSLAGDSSLIVVSSDNYTTNITANYTTTASPDGASPSSTTGDASSSITVRTPTAGHAKSKSYERRKRPSQLFQPFTDNGVHRPSLLLNTPQTQQQGLLYTGGQKMYRHTNTLSTDPLPVGELQSRLSHDQVAADHQTPYHRVTASLSGIAQAQIGNPLHSPKRNKTSKPVTPQHRQLPASPTAQALATDSREKSYSKAISEVLKEESKQHQTASSAKASVPTGRQLTHAKRGSMAEPTIPLLPDVAIPMKQVYIVFMCLTTCLGMSALDTTIVNVAAPTITQEFGSFALFGWLTSAYMLSSSAFTPIYGKASDIFGRSMAMQVAITFFFGGSLLGALAPSMTVLIAARGLQGIGGAGLNSLTSVIVGDMLSPAEQGRYIYILSISYTFFSVIGPIVGGVFTDAVSWRWIFWINLPICCVSSLIVHFYMRGIPIRQRRVHSWKDIDWLGSATVLTATGSLVFAVISGGSTFAWDSPPIIATLSAAGALIALFIYSQHKAGHKALMPLHMYKNRNFSLANGIMFLCGAVSFGISSYLPSYFESVVKDSALVSGLRTLPFIGCTVIATTMSGQVIARFGHYYSLPLIGSPLQLLGCVMLAVYLSTTESYVWLSLTMAAIGLGIGLTQPVMNVLIQLSVPVADMAAGVTSGLFFRQLGGACGVAICSSIFNNLYTQRLTQLATDRQLTPLPSNALNLNNDQIAALGPATVEVFAESYVYGLATMYAAVAAFAGVTCILCYLLKKVDIPSRGKPPAKPIGDELDTLADKPLADPDTNALGGDGALHKSAVAYHVDSKAATTTNATVIRIASDPSVQTEVEHMQPVSPLGHAALTNNAARASLSSPMISTDGLHELSGDEPPHSPPASMRAKATSWVLTPPNGRASHQVETMHPDDVKIDVASMRNSPAQHLRSLKAKRAAVVVKSTRSIQTQTPPLPMLQLDRIYLPTGYEPTHTNNPAFTYAPNHSPSSASPANDTRVRSPSSATHVSVSHAQPLFTPNTPRVVTHTSAPVEHHSSQQSHSRQAHHDSSSPAEQRRERLRAMSPTPLIVATHPPDNGNTLGLHSIKRANIPLSPSPRASGQSLPFHVMHALRSNAPSRAGSMRAPLPITTMQQLSPRQIVIDDSFNPLNSIK